MSAALTCAVFMPPYGSWVRHFSQASKSVTTKLDSPKATTPKKLIIMDARTAVNGDDWGLQKIMPGADIQHGMQRSLDEIIQTIEKHVISHGTLDELALSAHTVPNRILFSKEAAARFTTFEFLQRLENMQTRLGKPIAGRIVFLGCNVFTDQTPESVAAYRKHAAALGADIVGTTTRNLAGIYQSARYAVIGRDGQVRRDRIDVALDPVAWVMQLETRYISRRNDNLFAVAARMDSGQKAQP